jgi:protein subunit release factor A
MPFIKNQCMFVYADADLDSNQKMQEPLQKLYQYENKPDMREKIREYISELDTEIDRLKNLLKNTDSPYDLQIKGRLNAIIEVKNDLLGRLEEVI